MRSELLTSLRGSSHYLETLLETLRETHGTAPETLRGTFLETLRRLRLVRLVRLLCPALRLSLHRLRLVLHLALRLLHPVLHPVLLATPTAASPSSHPQP